MSSKGKKKKPNIPLDDFHFHEVYDRCHSINTMIDELLVTHPVIERNEAMMEEVIKAQRCLCRASDMTSRLQEKITTHAREVTA